MIIGAIGGLLWMGVNQAANQIAGGEVVEARGRRQGQQRMLVWVAELLGPSGTIAVGVGLLALVVAWAAMRVIKRPERTVWKPDELRTQEAS